MSAVGPSVNIDTMWSALRRATIPGPRSGRVNSARRAAVGLLTICIGAGLALNAPRANAKDVPAPAAAAGTPSTSLATGDAGVAPLSGTIIDGVFTTSPAVGCHVAPDCAAWAAAGCPGALAGVDPALHASIVAVEGRAGTPRAFEVRRGTGESILLGGVEVQFWTNRCTEIQPSWNSFWDCRLDPACSSKRRYVDGTGLYIGREWVRTTLSIPAGSAWMTVSANDNLNIDWTLR
jgi:hypothetical protein